MQSIPMCPTCGSERIKAVRRTVTRRCKGQAYRVPNLAFHECPDCGEQVYDPQAMRKIQDHSPAYARRRVTRRPAKTARPARLATVKA